MTKSSGEVRNGFPMRTGVCRVLSSARRILEQRFHVLRVGGVMHEL